MASSPPASSRPLAWMPRIGSSLMWLPLSVIGPSDAKWLEGLRDHQENHDDEQEPGHHLDRHRCRPPRGRRLLARAARAPQVRRQKGTVQPSSRHVEKESEEKPAGKQFETADP